jgi:hypothetical protein
MTWPQRCLISAVDTVNRRNLDLFEVERRTGSTDQPSVPTLTGRVQSAGRSRRCDGGPFDWVMSDRAIAMTAPRRTRVIPYSCLGEA